MDHFTNNKLACSIDTKRPMSYAGMNSSGSSRQTSLQICGRGSRVAAPFQRSQGKSLTKIRRAKRKLKAE
ncbi:hypothetical protein RvY_13456 [Ramazzottius varieornatus]|uniref:Uncharacterized protein n=1 Tax=Ramazzottius varieornatus TaxID=947166 RepID=A0A1D1VQ42_RAMVA|nr:hypothetical protein RvY_13456 [Ramazzottius varieornatus]